MVELVTAPKTTDLITVAQALVRVPGGDSAVLGTLIKEASTMISSWVGRSLYRAQWKESRPGSGGRRLALSQRPAVALDSVVESTSTLSDCTLVKGQDMVTRDAGFGDDGDPLAWVVTYVGGYFLAGDDYTGTVSVAAGDSSYNTAASDFHPFLRAGDILVASGFTNPANNGPKVVVSATTAKIVVGGSLTTEGSASARSFALKNVPGQVERVALELVALNYLAASANSNVVRMQVGPAEIEYAKTSSQEQVVKLRQQVEALALGL